MNNGTKVKGEWANLPYTYNWMTKIYTYHFNNDGLLDSGWIIVDGKWYLLSTVHDGWFGCLKTGWNYDENDGKWYYLNSPNGEMLTGWQKINGVWYYLTTEANRETGRPFGSMYQNEVTPDGYYVDDSGKWIQ